MKKSIIMMAALLFAACGGNATNDETDNTTDKEAARNERIDELTANAKEAFHSGSEAVSEFAKDAEVVLSKSAEEVGQRTKASITNGEIIYNKAKAKVDKVKEMEAYKITEAKVIEATEVAKERVVEAADVVSKKSVELGATALEKGAEAMEAGSEALREVRENME